MTAEIIYKGDLRCECLHIQSGSTFETDAPTDNRGKGQRFSPTDTVCVALATCIITTMGIRATDMGIDLMGTKISVTKHMLTDPRRIGKIDITLDLPNVGLNDQQKEILTLIGNNCPVMKSLHPALEISVQYNWK